jgi:hypothetical protein
VGVARTRTTHLDAFPSHNKASQEHSIFVQQHLFHVTTDDERTGDALPTPSRGFHLDALEQQPDRAFEERVQHLQRPVARR